LVAELGFEVVSADTGEKALSLLGAQAFDLLITDVAMPGMNGVELGRRARQAAPDMPILFASGYADLHNFGADLDSESLMRKPFRLAEVAARIHQALDEAGA
jgi:DNA-binding response OmpR family regulator